MVLKMFEPLKFCCSSNTVTAVKHLYLAGILFGAIGDKTKIKKKSPKYENAKYCIEFIS